MSARYRLAVIEGADGAQAVIEREGGLHPLAAVLGADLPAGGAQDLLPILQAWDRLSALLAERAPSLAGGIDAATAHFLPPVALPNKLICIGSNYKDHIAEMQIPMLPTYPYSFLKPPSTTLRGSGQPVEVPAQSQMVDWEAELAVVIGRRARHVAAADALGIVAGYANFNDLSARDWIEKRPAVGIDWVRHKAFDGFAPMGPYILPAQFVADPQDLAVTLHVNGVPKQQSNTAQMVFGVAEIIEHLSSIMTLEPGDVIATGTPAGVGHGRNPQEFLKAGDVVTIEIGELGVLETPMV